MPGVLAVLSHGVVLSLQASLPIPASRSTTMQAVERTAAAVAAGIIVPARTPWLDRNDPPGVNLAQVLLIPTWEAHTAHVLLLSEFGASVAPLKLTGRNLMSWRGANAGRAITNC